MLKPTAESLQLEFKKFEPLKYNNKSSFEENYQVFLTYLDQIKNLLIQSYGEFSRPNSSLDNNVTFSIWLSNVRTYINDFYKELNKHAITAANKNLLKRLAPLIEFMSRLNTTTLLVTNEGVKGLSFSSQTPKEQEGEAEVIKLKLELALASSVDAVKTAAEAKLNEWMISENPAERNIALDIGNWGLISAYNALSNEEKENNTHLIDKITQQLKSKPERHGADIAAAIVYGLMEPSIDDTRRNRSEELLKFLLKSEDVNQKKIGLLALCLILRMPRSDENDSFVNFHMNGVHGDAYVQGTAQKGPWNEDIPTFNLQTTKKAPNILAVMAEIECALSVRANGLDPLGRAYTSAWINYLKTNGDEQTNICKAIFKEHGDFFINMGKLFQNRFLISEPIADKGTRSALVLNLQAGASAAMAEEMIKAEDDIDRRSMVQTCLRLINSNSKFSQEIIRGGFEKLTSDANNKTAAINLLVDMSKLVKPPSEEYEFVSFNAIKFIQAQIQRLAASSNEFEREIAESALSQMLNFSAENYGKQLANNIITDLSSSKNEHAREIAATMYVKMLGSKNQDGLENSTDVRYATKALDKLMDSSDENRKSVGQSVLEKFLKSKSVSANEMTESVNVNGKQRPKWQTMINSTSTFIRSVGAGRFEQLATSDNDADRVVATNILVAASHDENAKKDLNYSFSSLSVKFVHEQISRLAGSADVNERTVAVTALSNMLTLAPGSEVTQRQVDASRLLARDIITGLLDKPGENERKVVVNALLNMLNASNTDVKQAAEKMVNELANSTSPDKRSVAANVLSTMLKSVDNDRVRLSALDMVGKLAKSNSRNNRNVAASVLLFVLQKPTLFVFASVPVSEKINMFAESTNKYERDVAVRVLLSVRKKPNTSGQPSSQYDADDPKLKKVMKIVKSVEKRQHSRVITAFNKYLPKPPGQAEEALLEKMKDSVVNPSNGAAP